LLLGLTSRLVCISLLCVHEHVLPPFRAQPMRRYPHPVCILQVTVKQVDSARHTQLASDFIARDQSLWDQELIHRPLGAQSPHPSFSFSHCHIPVIIWERVRTYVRKGSFGACYPIAWRQSDLAREIHKILDGEDLCKHLYVQFDQHLRHHW
jgi:hypothetical protein